MVVDDNEINRKVLGIMLESKSVNVNYAENGEIAIEAVKKSNYHCVLMDIEMPVMDGFEAVKIMSSIKPNLPVIAITAQLIDEFYSHENSNLFAGLISKPETVSRVLKAIRDTINKPVV